MNRGRWFEFRTIACLGGRGDIKTIIIPFTKEGGIEEIDFFIERAVATAYCQRDTDKLQVMGDLLGSTFKPEPSFLPSDN